MKRKSQSKAALITGGGSGIGLALAQTFSRAGYSVIITGRDLARLQDAAHQLQNKRDKSRNSASVSAIPCDVRDPESVEKLMIAVQAQHPAIDVLINNAGVAHALSTVDKLDPQIWKQVIETNLTGAFLITRAALRMMGRGGTIVNNLSISAVEVFAGMSAYNAAKAGALGFTNTLREELREKGIRVLALLPGATDTDIWRQFWPEAPREKMISPDTVAEIVLHAVLVPAETSVDEIRIGPAAGAL